MLDIAGAARTITYTATNDYLLSMGVDATLASEKASWNVAIAGAYALIEPHVHVDYTTSDELFAWLEELQLTIDTQIETVYNSHQHGGVMNGGGMTGTPTMPMSVAVPLYILIPMEVFLPIISRPISLPITSVSAASADLTDIEYGAYYTEMIPAYSRSSVLGLLY